ncbi:hypothetical protein [Clostridium sporogenes]|uniref:hypothetical protein n=1 Tax=Clostridium sporogenes TaxID=1509 RepID=UPI0022373889|nr:hypothetical protein [Clostridium sporogenes]MCW6078084.1 hypothetical protein [Clostridium sporogenes]
MDINERFEEKNYYRVINDDGVIFGNQYFELQRIYKEVIDENMDWIMNDFINKNLNRDNVCEYGRVTFFKEDREKLKEKLRNYLIFVNMGRFLKDTRIATLLEYKDEGIIEIN